MKEQDFKKRKQTMKGSRGITLVALIITIIVLLILAVVAISAVNNTGIIQHAQNSADEYTDGRDKENTTLVNYVDILNHYKPGGDKTNPPDPEPPVGTTLSQIREGDVWQNVTIASNISNKGITIPQTVIGYDGLDSIEIPVNEVEFEFNVVSNESNTLYRIKYGLNAGLPTGEKADFLYIEKQKNGNPIGLYIIVFESVGNYNKNVVYSYNLSNGNVEQYNGNISIQGTVSKVECEYEAEEKIMYTYYSPILDGLKSCFTGTVDYMQ